MHLLYNILVTDALIPLPINGDATSLRTKKRVGSSPAWGANGE